MYLGTHSKKTVWGAAALTLALAWGLLALAFGPDTTVGEWTPAGQMSSVRYQAASLALADGRILITGGSDANAPVSSAEFFDGAGVFSPAPSMVQARGGHTATLLRDGRVLVVGGFGSDGSILDTAEVFDSSTNGWSLASSPMLVGRVGHTATLLEDGRVLVAGGLGTNGVDATYEVFDPAAGGFTSWGQLGPARVHHGAALLPDNRVLIVGGSDGSGALSSSTILDPADGSLLDGPSLSIPRSRLSATALLDGHVLVAGGSNAWGDQASAELFDPDSGEFLPLTSQLSEPRSGHAAILLPQNNNVLIVGGQAGQASLSSSDLYLPWSESFQPAGGMAEARNGLALAALGGAALATGGSASTGAEWFGFATVATDRDDYSPGEPVTVTGTGWVPGEQVTLLFQEAPHTHGDRVLTTTADGEGRIFSDSFAPEDHDLGVRFYLTALGSVSGAQTTFMDSPKVGSVTLGSQSPSPVTAGNSATYAVTVFRGSGGGSSGAFTADLVVTMGLPAGASASFSVNPVSFTPTQDMRPSVLTVTTTGSTPGGLFTFTVRAFTSGGDEAFVNGTLNVTSPAPTKLVFTTSSFTRTIGACSPLTTVQTQRADGTPSNPPGGATVGLSSSSAGGAFFSDAGCTASIASVNIPSSANSASFYYKDGNAGSPTLTASSAGLTSATQVETIQKATPVFSGLSSPTIVYGSTPTSLSGNIAAGALIPTGNVTVTLNGTPQMAAIQPDGSFSSSFATGALGVGMSPYAIVYSYAGDSNFNAAGDGAGSLTVQKATPSFSGLSSPTIVYGSTPTALSGSVAAGSLIPTGNVTVTLNGTPQMAAIQLDGSFSSSFATGTLGVGMSPYAVVYSYAGDANFNAAGDGAGSLTVQKATPAFSGLSSPTITYGDTPTALSGSLATGSLIPTGSVAVTLNGTPQMAAIQPDGSFSSSFATGTLGVGMSPYAIVYSYAGDSNFNAAGDGAGSLTVQKATPAFSGLSSPTITYGDTPTALSGSVASGSLIPSGSVTVTLNGTPQMAAIQPDGSFSSSFATGTLGVGMSPYGIVYSYAGDSNFNAAGDGSGSLTVQKATPSFSGLSSPTIVYGSTPTALSGSVAAGSLIPTGSVTVTLNGAPQMAAIQPDGSFSSSFATGTLGVGMSPYAIVYSYAGDANFNAAGDGAGSLTVQKATPAFSGLSSPTITYGSTPTALSGSVAAGSLIPTGNVTVTLNGAPQMAAIQPDGSFSSSFATGALGAAGSPYAIVYAYAGDANFNAAANGMGSLTVQKATPAFSGLSSPTITYGSTPTALSGSVAAGSLIPTGNVTVTLNGAPQMAAIQPNGSFSSSFATGALGVGGSPYAIVYSYPGDSNFNAAANGMGSLTVGAANTSLSVGNSNAVFGDANATLTAQVSNLSTPAGINEGTVTFTVKQGATTIGGVTSGTVSGGAASALFPLTSPSVLSVGSYSILATYNPGSNFNSSSGGPAALNIAQAVASTSVTVTPNVQQYSDKVTLEATVSPVAINGQAPATQVTFKIGTQTMGTVPLASVGGALKGVLSNVALVEPTPFGASPTGQMAPGNRTVTAEFGGLNPNIQVSNASATLTIQREDARATYTGATFASTSCATCSGATVTLAATIEDITAVAPVADPAPGEIRHSNVTFVNRDAGNAVLCSASVGLVNPGDSKVGAATCNWNASISGDSQSFTVGVVVGGYYVRDNADDNTVVTVSKPLSSFITGGGYLILTNSGGLKAGDPGRKNNWGFNVKYNKSGKNLQGNINVIVRRTESDGLHVYQIKGNAMTSLSVNTATGVAIFNGKANIQDITDPLNPIALDGNATLQVNMTDRGEPGSSDSIGITLWDKNGGMWFSSSWNGVQTVERTLSGGNLVVH